MKNMKRIIALFCLIMMTVGVVSVAALAVDNDSIITETGNTITRAQWLHNLAVLFEMEVEDNNYPDNYYSDLSADHAYYIDMMLNIQFGVIDIPAGGELHPDDRLTREFAAQTLNSCLGYQLEEETYSFSDAEDCAYPADDQVAVNRGWFTLIGGAFLPKAEVQDNEVAVMVADTQTVLGQFEIDENYDSQYTFKDGVVEIPDGTDVTVEDEKVVILNNPVVLNEGQTFVVYINGVPAAYKATGVAVNGNTTTVNAEDVDSEDVLASADAQGSFELDENYEIIPAGNGEVTIDEEEVSVSPSKMPGLRKISGTKPIKRTLTVSNTLSLCDEASITFTVKITNPVIKYSYSTLKREAYTTIDGDAVVSFSANFDIAKAIPSDELELFTVPILGVGSFDVCLDLKLAGSLSGGTTGHLKTGISYTREDGFRLERSFKAKTFSITAEVTGQVGIVLRLGVTKLPVLNAYVWAKVGGKASVKVQQYLDGKKPKECVSFYAYEYASYGASAKVKFLAFSKSFDDEYVVWNETNSPHKIVHHYEDKKEVTACTRGGSNSGGNTGFYFSKGNSAYAGSGWSGSTSNSYGLSASGEPIVLYSYTLDEDENATITKYHGNARSLIMPETIDGYTITKIGGNAFSECTSLRHVRLSNKLTKLAGHSFRDCTSLESIFIPNTLVSGGSDYNPRGAFTNCSSLKDVTIEDGITKIPEFLFCGCNGITTVKIPSSVTTIEMYAFADCTNLKTIEIPDSVTTIEGAAFDGCKNLSSVKLSNNLTALAGHSFRDCTSLESIFIPNTLVSGGSDYNPRGAFTNCSSLKDVTIEDGITKIPEFLFCGCNGITTVKIPSSVTTIEMYAFADCTNLKTIEIPDSVTTIEGAAFDGCKNLSSVKLSNNLTALAGHSFRDCTSLESIFIPNTLVSGGSDYNPRGAFTNCSSLKDVTIEDGITKIPEFLFLECNGFETITIPDSVTAIGNYAFKDCTSLKDLQIPDSVTSIGYAAFSNCQSLTRISVPESVVSMGNLIFKNCSNLADVELPQNQSKIVQSMFENCMSLEHIDLPSSIKSIEKYAFNGCKALTTICIPTNTTIIYNHAFSNCPSLESFTFENEKATLNTIGTETFYNCTSLKEAILPETVTTINASAFQNCVALEKVYIPQSMKTLGESIFMGDESLNDVTIADYSITTMPKTAFKDCAGLESIVLPKGLTTISAQAFMNDTSLVSVTIPVSVTSIDPSAFSYPKKTVIRGVRGSTAESFANEYGFTFVDITNPAEGIALLDGVERIVMERGQTYRAVMEYYPEDTSDVIALTADNNKVSINGMDITAKAAGDCVITAAATSGVTYEFTVQIIDAKSIAVTTSPYKTNYILGEDLNCDGMVVTVTFNDGSTKEVTDYTVSGFDSSVEGDCTVTVSWVSANNITLKTTFVVHVIDTAPKLTGIAITTPPTHTTFERRASLDVSGMVVMGTYTDGSQQPITGYTLSGYNALKLGKQTITMSYEGFTDTFEVEVVSTSVPATGVSLDKTALSIAVGNSVTLTVTVTPVTATNPSVTWTSSDETVATVANGVVTAKKAGTATITATTVDGGFTATCTVTVTGAVDHTPGDINGDDTLNNKDLNRLMKYLAGEDVDVVEAALDLNGDGAVNNKDLNRLMKYLAGEDVEIF